MTLCLGIESTAHTFGASIANDHGVISDEKSLYVPPAGSGIHPREAAQHHTEVAHDVVAKSLRAASVKPGELDAVAFSQGPGLGPCLRVGATVARAISARYGVPLVPVNHAIGHIEIGALTARLVNPLVVLVSGGHTSILAFAIGRWRVFGETEDITLGNLLDMFARTAGLPSPGGPTVENLAQQANGFVVLPYVVKGCDVSYSGLLTAGEKRLNETQLPDLCFSLQEIAFSMLAEATERALVHTAMAELLLTGGVAANATLQGKLKEMCVSHGAKFGVVEKKYSGDCGAQIAWTGLLAHRAGVSVRINESQVRPRWRLDAVEIPWRS